MDLFCVTVNQFQYGLQQNINFVFCRILNYNMICFITCITQISLFSHLFETEEFCLYLLKHFFNKTDTDLQVNKSESRNYKNLIKIYNYILPSLPTPSVNDSSKVEMSELVKSLIIIFSWYGFLASLKWLISCFTERPEHLTFKY